MTAMQAIEKYSEKFGGFPYFLFMGADDEAIIEAVILALETGEEIKAPEENADY